jgi:hypothetical protein
LVKEFRWDSKQSLEVYAKGSEAKSEGITDSLNLLENVISIVLVNSDSLPEFGVHSRFGPSRSRIVHSTQQDVFDQPGIGSGRKSQPVIGFEVAALADDNRERMNNRCDPKITRFCVDGCHTILYDV